MSIPRNALRVFSRAALASTRSSTVLFSWALRSASLSTSSGGNASHWAQERPPKPAPQAPERRGPPPGKCFMAVHITGLDPSLTLAELLQSIAETAPVGMILSARLLPAEGRAKNNPPSPPPPPPSLKADIIFGNENAPYELRQRARDKTFLVRGRPPFVAVNTQLVFDHPKADLRRSRVLRIRGPPGLEGFDEAAMRGVLASSAAAVDDAAGARGVEAEPVETREEDDGVEGVTRVMEWRFFDNGQAHAFKHALREHYGRALEIDSGPDPCWDYREMMRYLSRSRNRGRERGPFRQPQRPPHIVNPSVPVYPAYFLETAARTEGYRSTDGEDSQTTIPNRG